MSSRTPALEIRAPFPFLQCSARQRMFDSSTWTSHAGQAARADAAHRRDIDGLRAIAVLSVVLNHLSVPMVPGGFVGVDVFFVISGYLITGIVHRELEEGRFSFLRFYERRARRIFPALFAMLGATLGVCLLVMLPTDLLATLRAALATLFFLSNLVFWKMDAGYFEETESRTNPLLHTWSLGVEEQFYVLFPLAFLLAHGLLRDRARVALALLAAAVLSFVGTAVILDRGNVSAAFYLSPFRAWELLGGAVLALGAIPPIRSALARELACAAGVCSVLAACVLYDESTLFPGTAALLPVLGTMAVIHAGTSGPTLAARLLGARPLVYVGLISYSLYLWHWPVVVLAQYLNGMEPVASYAALLLAISLLLASLSFHVVEQPFRNVQPRQGRRSAGQAVAFVAVAAVVCAAGLASTGFPQRFAPSVAAMDAARMQELPYRQCSDVSPAKGCRLGAEAAGPTMVLWGDSHLMAVAPVLHELLLRAGASAVFVPATGCAPVFGADSRIKPGCRRHADEVAALLNSDPKLQTVVLTAFWSTYFREDGPLALSSPGTPNVEGGAAAQKALVATLESLSRQVRRVVVIGPVPTYNKSVPAALALGGGNQAPGLDLAARHQVEKNALFMEAARGALRFDHVRLVEPMAWMCDVQCRVVEGGRSMYRDAHHLSIDGGKALASRLNEALARIFRERPDRPEARPIGSCSARLVG